jgi:hypothetical protein
MEIKRTLQPGQNGTKELLRRYGEQLVCVRYRYDQARQKRYKTVELIIDEQPWVSGVVIPAERPVLLKIGYGEAELREQVKAAGGYWCAEQKAWRLPFRKVVDLGLERRLIEKEECF